MSKLDIGAVPDNAIGMPWKSQKTTTGYAYASNLDLDDTLVLFTNNRG